MNINQKSIGSVLVGFSLILLFILIVVKFNVDKEEAYVCSITHADPKLNIEECPAHNSNNSWLLVSAFGLSFLILASGVLLLFLPVKKEGALEAGHPVIKEVDVSTLDEEEKKIYGLIKLKEGSMYQSDLIKETGLTKVRISRILDKLEGRGIIERKRRGMTNIVVLH